jgi:glyoxylase-like metal-dependent hydrolase (beta-lactamase superfamily II)
LANGPGIINPVVIWDEKDVVLFDAGLPGMREDFREASVNASIPFEKLNHVLITHADMDHIGSLSQIIHEGRASITVMAHQEEKPYIECERQPIRLKQMESALESITGVMRVQMEALATNLRQNYKRLCVKVDKTIEDGEGLPICGGITGIYTPGHTPGHMSYYLNKVKLLIAGDILQVENGLLRECPDMTIIDKAAVAASLKKLSGYKIETVVCYHGGLFHGDVSKQIGDIIAQRSWF